MQTRMYCIVVGGAATLGVILYRTTGFRGSLRSLPAWISFNTSLNFTVFDDVLVEQNWWTRAFHCRRIRVSEFLGPAHTVLWREPFLSVLRQEPFLSVCMFCLNFYGVINLLSVCLFCLNFYGGINQNTINQSIKGFYTKGQNFWWRLRSISKISWQGDSHLFMKFL